MTLARIALALSLCATCAGASASLIVNGDFEAPKLGLGIDDTVSYVHGSTGIPGWTTIGDVQLVGAGFQSLSGSGGGQWVDLTGTTEGYFKGLTSNAFSTTIGQTYAITFDLGALTTPAYGPATVDVRFSGLLAGTSTNNPTINGPGTFAMDWSRQTLNFVAISTSSVISFVGVPGQFSNANVVGLDNVSVAAIPEPHEWAMMLAGLGLVGFAARRRRDPRCAVTSATA